MSVRVVHYTNNDFDGAGRAVLRLHRGFLKLGIDSSVIVLYKRTLEDGVIAIGFEKTIRDRLDYLKQTFRSWGFDLHEIVTLFRQAVKWIWHSRIRVYWKPRTLFNFNEALVPYEDLKRHSLNADVVCFHSIQDIVAPEYIAKLHQETAVPIIFHPLDMEPMTGGCHFNFGCDRYTATCGHCPQLGRAGEHDISNTILENKVGHYSTTPMHVVATNSFVSKRLRGSKVFGRHPISTAFIGIEPERYTLTDKQEARRQLQLPMNEKIILFGCFNLLDRRKGAHLLKEALDDHFIPLIKADSQIGPVRLVTFGSVTGYSFDDLDMHWTHLGYVESSDKMNLVYRAADVLVSPSIDDMGPLIVQEAFMNHVPIISFDLGVSVDLVINGVNGYRVPCFDVEKFGEALYLSLSLNVNANWAANTELQNLWSQCTLQSEASAFAELIDKICYPENKAKVGLCV